jgi:hypothetical protein
MLSRAGLGARTVQQRDGFLPVRSLICGLTLIGLGMCIAPRAAAQDNGETDSFAHAYDFEPHFAQADDIPPWGRSGVVLSIGVGSQYAGLGAQLAYDWLHLCSGFALAPYASAGALPGLGEFRARPGVALGAMASYGGRNRWLLDLGVEPIDLEGFRFGGALAAERVLYGATLQLGRQWMGPKGIFFRLLVGAALSIDAYLPADLHFAVSLGTGWKP